MLIQDKIELYEKLEKYLLNLDIETIKIEKEPIQNELTDFDVFLKQSEIHPKKSR